MIGCSSGDASGVLSCPIWSTVLQCAAADAHLKLLDRQVCGDCFLTGGVIECDIAHRRSVVVLCMLVAGLTGVTRCTRLLVLYVGRMCQCGYTCFYSRT